MNATAEAGFFDMDTSMLKMSGGIAVYSDNGYELHTESADVDLKKGLFMARDRDRSGSVRYDACGPLRCRSCQTAPASAMAMST